jgi:hypothetical protein
MIISADNMGGIHNVRVSDLLLNGAWLALGRVLGTGLAVGLAAHSPTRGMRLFSPSLGAVSIGTDSASLRESQARHRIRTHGRSANSGASNPNRSPSPAAHLSPLTYLRDGVREIIGKQRKLIRPLRTNP